MAHREDDIRDPDTSGYLGKESIRQTAENAEIAANTSTIGPGSDSSDRDEECNTDGSENSDDSDNADNAETSGDGEQDNAEESGDSATADDSDAASAPAEPEEATGNYEVAEGIDSADSSESSALGRSIEDAHEAARKAGFAIGDEPDSTDHSGWAAVGIGDLPDRPHVSYSFLLEDLPDVPDVNEVEEAVEELDGVQCRIVYPSSTAWVTAPDTMSPMVILEAFAAQGISATMSETSLLRYAARAQTAEHHTRRKPVKDIPSRMRRRRRVAARSLDKARRAGYGQPRQEHKHDDVLYTARDLVTPARMWLALVLTIPVLVMAYFEPAQFDGWQWVSLALATPVVTWCALPFHRAMLGGVRRGIAALDGASSIAAIIAYVWSAAVIAFAPTGHRGWHSTFSWFAFAPGTADGPELFLDVACGITTLLLIGRRYSIRARTLLIDELTDATVSPDTEYTRISKKRGGADCAEEMIPVAEINRGDDIVVHAGETIPVDGKIMGGRALLQPGLIDMHEPMDVKVGSVVYSGSVIREGEIKVRAQRTGHATRWQAVHHWLTDVERRQRHASVQYARAAALLLPVAMTVAFFSFILWGLIARDYNAALRTALAVLSGVAPPALALSPALALRLGVESAARHGILVRDGETLRALEDVDTVVFNRVGTLAEPKMFIESVTALEGESEEMVLRIAGALSMESSHPASRALVHGAREARSQSDDDPHMPVRYELVSMDQHPSGDMTGRISMIYVDEEGHETATQVDAQLWRPVNLSNLHGALAVAATSGGTPVVVSWRGKNRGVITLFDPFKDDADAAVMALESRGLETVMLTRDTYPVARRYADYLGVSTVLAGIMHDRKPGAIRNLRAGGARVAAVGDNTITEALRAANVSLMYATADDIETGQQRRRKLSAVLLRNDVMAVPQLIVHAQRVGSIIDRNQVLAWSYNIAVLVAAVAGVIPPIVATVLMLGASLLIEVLSMRARRFPRINRL